MTTSGDTNYPPGVTGAEDVFYDEDAPCQCGHQREDHGDDGPCEIRNCTCTAYDPYDEEDQHAY